MSTLGLRRVSLLMFALVIAAAAIVAGCGGRTMVAAVRRSRCSCPRTTRRATRRPTGPTSRKRSKGCSDCKILYSNATQDAAKQQNQAEAALTQGADVLVLDAGRRGLGRRDREEGEGAGRAGRQLRPADHGLGRRLLRLVRQRAGRQAAGRHADQGTERRRQAHRAGRDARRRPRGQQRQAVQEGRERPASKAAA